MLSETISYSDGLVKDMSSCVEELKEQFDDQLTAINENTNEIQQNYEYICRIDAKLDNLSARLDQMQLFLQKFGFQCENDAQFECKPLTKKEQELFLLLYTLDEHGPVTYQELSKKSGYAPDMIAQYVTNMVEKGVIIHKRYIHDKVYLKLDKQFKKMQAKENILQIQQRVLA